MDVVEGTLTLTAEDFGRALADMPENVRARRIMQVYAGLVILAGVGGGLLNIALTLRGMWIVLGVALLLYAQSLGRRAAKRQLAGMKDEERELRYCFDAQGLNIRTPVSDVSVRYSALYRQREVSTAFLLYTQERIAQIIPKRAFEAPQLDQIRQWLAAAVQERPRPKPLMRPVVIWVVLILFFLIMARAAGLMD